MLPISWPVSVILAFVLGFIHLGHSLAKNVQNPPPLFFHQVPWSNIF